jgi:DUF4097 and DUF4098 domain-containing protein YvlB
MTHLISWIFAGVLAIGGGVGDVGSNIAKNQTQFAKATESNQTIILSEETERFEQTYPFNSNGKISISNINGSVTIEAWDKNEIKLEWVKTADSKERLADVQVKIDARQDVFNIETDYGSWKNNNNGNWNRNSGKLNVNYRLMVPKAAILNEIETVNGSVDVSNMTNVTKVSAVNGQVRAKNLRGSAELSTVNGTTEADFESLQSGSKISLSTVNGSVNLIIPSDVNATLKADTVNGRIENDFGLPIRKGKYVGRDMYGKIGTGDVRINLNSVNGGLSVKRRKDGKPQNAVIDLLPAKSKDDADEDEDCCDEDEPSSANISREARKISVDAQRIAKESIAISAEAMKKARIEMEAANREMSEADREMKEAEIEYRTYNRNGSEYVDSGSNSITKTVDSFTVKGTPKIVVEAKNATVSIRGWDKQEISYTISKIAKSVDTSDSDFTINRSETGLSIVSQIKNTNDTRRNRVRIEILVPRKSNIKVSSRNEIRLSGVSGEFDLSGIDEAINVSDSVGKLQVSSVDGRVRVIGFQGEVDAKTIDGNVSLEGEFARISGKSIDGTFIVSMSENAGAEVESNSEEISVENLATSNKRAGRVQIGKGGSKFNFEVTDGKILIRNSSQIKTN